MAKAAIASWSSGKDSCLAVYEALKSGYDIKYLLNFISCDSKRCCFHGVESRLIKHQADCLGISLVQKEVTADMQKYEEEFKAAVLELKTGSINNMVFGDIYLLDHVNWVERVCKEIKINPIEPLWNKNPLDLVNNFIDLGFKAIVVSAQAEKLDSSFIGKEVTKDLVKQFVAKNICSCGENGEFHTFVIDGPIFKKRIEITDSAPVFKEGFWKYWFLDIKNYHVVDKN